MLYKVLSPDNLHDQRIVHSGIDEFIRGSNRSPAAEEVPAIPSHWTPQKCHPPSPAVSQLEPKTTPVAANKIRAETQKKYLGVRVRLPVRDLLHSYRKARGEETKDNQADVAWKFNVERKRVVREMTHGHLRSAEQSKWLKKMNVCPPKNVEDLLEDLVEVLETDLKQGESCHVQRPIEGDCPQGCSKGCPVSLRDLHPRTHYPVPQTDDAAFHYHLGYFYKNDAAHLNLVSPSHKSYSDSECHSPDCLVALAAECCGNMTEEDIFFSHQHCCFQTTKQQSHPHSPLLEVKEFGQDALSNTQSSKSSRGEGNYPLEASLKQYIPRSSGLTFFQFQLQQIKSSLIALPPKDLLSVDKYGNTLLHYAAIQGKRALAYGLACRMSHMSRIDTKNSRGQTALHLAAGQNQHLMVNDLISLGAWINERDFEGKTPVHFCAENGFLQVLQVIEKILKNGTDVDIDARDNHYLTPLHYVVLAHIATVQEFDNSEMGSEMHRFLALRKEQLLDGMRCLLRMGSSLYMQDRNGRNAIHFAEEKNDTEVLNFLYDHVDQMKAIGYKQFDLDSILDPTNQNAALLAMAAELPPWQNLRNSSKIGEIVKELTSKGPSELQLQLKAN